jgi:hypothetical protein
MTICGRCRPARGSARRLFRLGNAFSRRQVRPGAAAVDPTVSFCATTSSPSRRSARNGDQLQHDGVERSGICARPPIGDVLRRRDPGEIAAPAVIERIAVGVIDRMLRHELFRADRRIAISRCMRSVARLRPDVALGVFLPGRARAPADVPDIFGKPVVILASTSVQMLSRADSMMRRHGVHDRSIRSRPETRLAGAPRWD